MKAHILRRKKNLISLLPNRKLTGLVVNAEKIHYIFMPDKQNTGQHHNTQIDNKSLKNEAKFKRLGTVVKKVKSAFIKKPGEDWTQGIIAVIRRAEHFVFQVVIQKEIEIKIYKNLILLAVLYGTKFGLSH